MKCFECSRRHVDSDAVGVCSHCLAALCAEHVHVVDDPVTVLRPVAQAVSLPLHARVLLCGTCLAAVSQRHPVKESSFERQHA
jgi:hypothetical protein